MARELTETVAQSLASIVLAHVTRPYPHKLDHVLDGPAETLSPEALHPVFFGSFDWHSCVHGYWSLARLLRRFGTAAFAPDIVRLFDEQITPAKVAGEIRYFERPGARGFERPYGWAWLLKLAAELRAHPARLWGVALQPLADLVRDRLLAFLPVATYPIRSGAHGNTAFALRLAADYAVAAADADLLEAIRAKALAWYAQDRDCQAWEPGGDDFLSPALVEAACLARLMPLTAFRNWFDAFLPDLPRRQPATLFLPATVTDRTDGKLAHLDGLNLSRAWCWRVLAATHDAEDVRNRLFEQTAQTHLDAAMGGLDVTYMGQHWLASFALLALDGASKPSD